MLTFKKGTNDYSFEYIEYIINRLNKQGFLIKSLISIKNSKDLKSALLAKKNICLFAYFSSKKDVYNIEGNIKATSALLINELSKN